MAVWHRGCCSRVVSPDSKLQSASSKDTSSVYCKKQPPLFPNRVCVEMSSWLWFVYLFFKFFSFTDLENFKTQRRNAVRVREGQGVVLLCGPPPHSGGNSVCSYLSLLFVYLSCRCPPAWLIHAPRTWALWRDAVSLRQNAGRSTCRIASPIRHRPHIYLVSWTSCLCASLRSPDCLFALRRSAEWVIFTLGHWGPVSLISSWRPGETLACRLRRMSCGWGLARLSNNCSPWACFVCFSRALCTADIINGTLNPALLTPIQGSHRGFLLHRPCWL